MRYRAKAHVCNACPRKDACTDSDHGREIVRPLDPWPHSEAGRFHRGISLLLVVLGAADRRRRGRPPPRRAGAGAAGRRAGRPARSRHAGWRATCASHPANFPAPSPSQGLRMVVTGADGRRRSEHRRPEVVAPAPGRDRHRPRRARAVVGVALAVRRARRRTRASSRDPSAAAVVTRSSRAGGDASVRDELAAQRRCDDPSLTASRLDARAQARQIERHARATSSLLGTPRARPSASGRRELPRQRSQIRMCSRMRSTSSRTSPVGSP